MTLLLMDYRSVHNPPITVNPGLILAGLMFQCYRFQVYLIDVFNGDPVPESILTGNFVSKIAFRRQSMEY